MQSQCLREITKSSGHSSKFLTEKVTVTFGRPLQSFGAAAAKTRGSFEISFDAQELLRSPNLQEPFLHLVTVGYCFCVEFEVKNEFTTVK